MDDKWVGEKWVGQLKEFQPLSWVIVNGTADEKTWDLLVRTRHYLGYRNMIGPRIKYLILFQGAPIAAISYNRAALHVGARDAWLGWSEPARRALLAHLVNNNRFLILPWVRVKNLASHLLSQSLRRVKRDWLEMYGVCPYAAETFVDLSRYTGTSYLAANWRYVGETLGFSKVGNAFVYHGHRKGVFVYLLDRRLRIRLREFPQRPNPKLDRVRGWAMMLHCPDWSPELFAEVGLTESSVAELGQVLGDYLDVYAPCFSRIEQQQNSETYLKGLLSDLSRKSIEPIALRYRDENAVRTLQMFLKDAPWDDQQMKQLYQDRVVQIASDPNGMITVDGSDFSKKGKRSAGVHRQYCGSKGKIENCQAGVFIGYSGVNGYGLLDAQLYLPHVWFDEAHRAWWPSCDIPDTTEFRTKPYLALEMIQEAFEQRDLSFRWVGCDGAFGCDQAFRQGLPASVHFFADVHSSQHVYRKRPSWALPEHAGRGRKPTRLLPSEPSVLVSTVVDDKTVPWQEVRLMEGAKGPVEPLVKCCRIIEMQDGRDAEELWLYIRQYEDGRIKYALSNAPEDTDIEELHHAATLRWAIEQSFQECKSYLGMSNYETRSYQG